MRGERVPVGQGDRDEVLGKYRGVWRLVLHRFEWTGAVASEAERAWTELSTPQRVGAYRRVSVSPHGLSYTYTSVIPQLLSQRLRAIRSSAFADPGSILESDFLRRTAVT
jgi:hypothetical protein